MARWFWILDVLVVGAFVVIGREDHGFDSTFSDYADVAGPFLIALAIMIFIVRAWRNPTDWRTGLGLAFGTVFLGMLLRRYVWEDGTARAFVLVTTAFFVAGMVGWRLIAKGVSVFLASRVVQTD